MEPADRSGNLLFSNHYFADITTAAAAAQAEQQVAKNFLLTCRTSFSHSNSFSRAAQALGFCWSLDILKTWTWFHFHIKQCLKLWPQSKPLRRTQWVIYFSWLVILNKAKTMKRLRHTSFLWSFSAFGIRHHRIKIGSSSCKEAVRAIKARRRELQPSRFHIIRDVAGATTSQGVSILNVSVSM